MSTRLRCFVTGATGFIGSHLVRALLGDGHQVTALIRPQADLYRISDCISSVDVIEGGLDDLEHLKSEFHRSRFDAACHLAWAGVTAEHRNDPKQLSWNVRRSLELWTLLQATGCATWLSVGSQAEYGLHSGIIREDLSPAPVTAYGTAKLALSLLMNRLCAMANMRFVWLRLFSTYGPADDDHHMVPSLIHALLRRERYALTAGEQIWDFLYISDVVTALVMALESPKVEGIFNLASGSPGPLRDFMGTIRNYIDPSLPLGIGDLPYRPDQIMHLEGDASRFRATCEWVPRIEWSEGIRQTVEWYRNRENNSI